MQDHAQDPVHIVKALLGRNESGSLERGAVAALAPVFREIHARLSKARRTDERIALSDAVDRLLADSLG